MNQDLKLLNLENGALTMTLTRSSSAVHVKQSVKSSTRPSVSLLAAMKKVMMDEFVVPLIPTERSLPFLEMQPAKRYSDRRMSNNG